MAIQGSTSYATQPVGRMMKQLVQSVKNGHLRLVEHPDLGIEPTELRVAVHASLISSGTERSTHQLASSSLIRKAQARPDLVRAVVDRARRDGIRSTIDAVRSRLDEDMPVGYSAAGIVTGVGEAASGFRPGDRVVTAGVGHAELQPVPANLAARLPAEVTFEEGAFGAIASVALHGLRLADVGPGGKIVVIGLGLIGQLAVRLALASGCTVAATDIDNDKALLAEKTGASVFESSPEGLEAILDWSRGRGADAVLVTAATGSSEPMRAAAQVARDRATVVAVGDVGLELDRRPLYEKELTIRVSRAYGPGRYDPAYEQLAVDYPIGYVRWPIGRNLEAVVDLMADRRLEVRDLITHRFPFDQAVAAYTVFDGADPYLGILLEYEASNDAMPFTPLRRTAASAAPAGRLRSGLIGAGRFASGVLLPAATAAGFGPWTLIASKNGASAVRVGGDHGFDRAVADPEAIFEDEDTDVVFVASRHDSHAGFVEHALESGKHVFCEKPLALTTSELDSIIGAVSRTSGVLMVGFNRRWAPAVEQAIDFVGRGTPVQIIYRIHAGALPDTHWLRDRRQGGRLLGEACHFVDTCNAVVGEAPRAVHAIGDGEGEAALQEDFTVTLEYESGSHAVIVYSAGAPRGAGKERIEVIRGDRSAVIDDFATLTLRDATGNEVVRFKPADKGHRAEFVAFKQAIGDEKRAAEVTRSALETSRVTLAAVESLMTGAVTKLAWV